MRTAGIGAVVVTVVAALAAWPSQARAGEGAAWSAAFPAGSVGTYLDADKARVLVAVGGDRDAISAAASTSLAEALRKSGRASVVMDDSALGSLTGLDDRQIVHRADRLPLDRVLVLRLFPGGEPGARVAVATIYDLKGVVVAGFTAEPASPVAIRGATGSASQGVSSEAATAVSRVLREAPAVPVGRARTPRDEYDEQVVGFLDPPPGEKVNWDLAYVSNRHLRISGATFYDRIGRFDLANAYRTRRDARPALIGIGAGLVGAALITGGSLLGFWNKTGQCDYSSYGYCIDYAERPLADRAVVAGPVMGLGVAGGIAMMIAGVLLPRNPVSIEEGQRLAKEFNARLRKRLQVDGREDKAPSKPGDAEDDDAAKQPGASDPDARRAPLPPARFTLLPTAGPTGAALTFDLRY